MTNLPYLAPLWLPFFYFLYPYLFARLHIRITSAVLKRPRWHEHAKIDRCLIFYVFAGAEALHIFGYRINEWHYTPL